MASDMELPDTKPQRGLASAQRSGDAMTAQPTAVEPTAVEPTAVEPTAAEPTFLHPDAVDDALVVATSDAITAPIAATAAPAGEPAPAEVVDEPSDGVIRDHIATAETAPVKRPPPDERLDDDRPGDATGEITMRRQRPPIEVRHSEPSILVADLAAVHAAVGVVADEQVTAPTTPDAASPSHEAPVADVRDDAAEVRDDAVEFSDAEEAFFRAGHERDATPAPQPSAESFDDLDEGYRRVGFWERLRGKPPPGK